MAAPRTITVTLPDCLTMAPDDLDVLRTTLQTVITLASADACGPDERLRAMQAEGWEVNWGLTWIARARRAGTYEEATGATKDEVLTRLERLVRLREVEGTP